MVKKINWQEIIIIVPPIVFLVFITMYHLSYYGYLGFPKSVWKSVYAIANNGLFLSLCITIIILIQAIKNNSLGNYQRIKNMFWIVFVPYFTLKIIYDVTCYLNIYITSKDVWEDIWSIALVLLIFVCLSIYFIMPKIFKK